MSSAQNCGEEVKVGVCFRDLTIGTQQTATGLLVSLKRAVSKLPIKGIKLLIRQNIVAYVVNTISRQEFDKATKHGDSVVPDALCIKP